MNADRFRMVKFQFSQETFSLKLYSLNMMDSDLDFLRYFQSSRYVSSDGATKAEVILLGSTSVSEHRNRLKLQCDSLDTGKNRDAGA